MKRFFIVFLPAILMIALGVIVNAESVDDTATIAFNVTPYLTLTVHAGVDLGTISSATSVLESTDNPVEVISSVPYTLTVEVQNVTAPAGHPDVHGDYANFLKDFYVKGGALATYTFFTKKGDAGKVTVADTSTGGDNTYQMSYKYEADVNDIPGAYSITLKYTVTTK